MTWAQSVAVQNDGSQLRLTGRTLSCVATTTWTSIFLAHLQFCWSGPFFLCLQFSWSGVVLACLGRRVQCRVCGAGGASPEGGKECADQRPWQLAAGHHHVLGQPHLRAGKGLHSRLPNGIHQKSSTELDSVANSRLCGIKPRCAPGPHWVWPRWKHNP
jgi:hypothetical protein